MLGWVRNRLVVGSIPTAPTNTAVRPLQRSSYGIVTPSQQRTDGGNMVYKGVVKILASVASHLATMSPTTTVVLSACAIAASEVYTVPALPAPTHRRVRREPLSTMRRYAPSLEYG